MMKLVRFHVIFCVLLLGCEGEPPNKPLTTIPAPRSADVGTETESDSAGLAAELEVCRKDLEIARVDLRDATMEIDELREAAELAERDRDRYKKGVERAVDALNRRPNTGRSAPRVERDFGDVYIHSTPRVTGDEFEAKVDGYVFSTKSKPQRVVLNIVLYSEGEWAAETNLEVIARPGQRTPWSVRLAGAPGLLSATVEFID